MNYVMITKDGVGIVVDKKEWETYSPNLIKTTMSDEQIKDMNTFINECGEYIKLFN